MIQELFLYTHFYNSKISTKYSSFKISLHHLLSWLSVFVAHDCLNPVIMGPFYYAILIQLT